MLYQINNDIENYENMQLPNTNTIRTNYPVNSPITDKNIQHYPSPNQATDKYFKQDMYEEIAESGNKLNPMSGDSLVGPPIDKSNFKHNNMTPYFGAKIRGGTVDSNITEGVLDNKQGGGSQHFKKQAVAPLFAPEENVQYTHGAPNNSDFYQSRVNPSMQMNNVKPWEEEKIAPGLNQGYGTSGSNGFNSGMESRDKWLPLTVDELRVKTNPKVSYSLDDHKGPANSKVHNLGVLGKVEKNRPDTDFKNDPDRWFTTTGLEKGQTSRAIEELKDVNRINTSREYYGTKQAADANSEMAPQNYQQSHRSENKTHSIPAPNGMRGKAPATTGDYGVKGVNILPNNRETTNDGNYGFFGSGAIGAMVSPLLDILRPSRKENVIGNARIFGNHESTVKNGQIYNPADRTKVTNRQMQEGKLDCNHLNIENQQGGAYQTNDQQSISNNRDTSVSYFNNGANPSGNQVYNAAYNQRNNVNKSYESRPNQGGMQLLNSNMNIKIDKMDTDRDNNRTNIITTKNIMPPSTEQYGPSASKQEYKEPMDDRNASDILSAFKSNPYTQSLNSWA
jgi:hypothetical protein